jgi:hypothetical protein
MCAQVGARVEAAIDIQTRSGGDLGQERSQGEEKEGTRWRDTLGGKQ